MLDLYMIVLLAGTFCIFYGFAAWCDRVIGETGGEKE